MSTEQGLGTYAIVYATIINSWYVRLSNYEDINVPLLDIALTWCNAVAKRAFDAKCAKAHSENFELITTLSLHAHLTLEIVSPNEHALRLKLQHGQTTLYVTYGFKKQASKSTLSMIVNMDGNHALIDIVQEGGDIIIEVRRLDSAVMFVYQTAVAALRGAFPDLVNALANLHPTDKENDEKRRKVRNRRSQNRTRDRNDRSSKPRAVQQTNQKTQRRTR